MDPIGTHTSKSEAQPNAKQKRYVVLGCLHTVFSIVRHAIQPRRKERSSAKSAALCLPQLLGVLGAMYNYFYIFCSASDFSH